MVEAIPEQQNINDALTEKLTEITNAANVISQERSSFTELKALNNPPKLV